jgi:hypothetical protein
MRKVITANIAWLGGNQILTFGNFESMIQQINFPDEVTDHACVVINREL